MLWIRKLTSHPIRHHTDIAVAVTWYRHKLRGLGSATLAKYGWFKQFSADILLQGSYSSISWKQIVYGTGSLWI